MKKTLPLISFTIIVLCCCLSAPLQAQFLHVSGKKIVDKDNNEVILRGMGLGGWMLQEGYMLETNSFANPQHQIRAKIKDLIGEDNTVEFYNAWLANHCTKRDIDSLKAWGFNSIRLPMHYNLYTLPIEQEPVAGENTWLEKGFEMTDNLLAWCEANEMYLILDLHAAPGGQGKDAAISDYDSSKPSLWESDANKQKTVALWRKLAERYANEEWIGAYDILNEPNWSFTTGGNQNGCTENSNAPLRQLYVQITTAIREVDDNHIIIIEGNCWGNNYNNMFPKWDNNMAASFHKYWSNNDMGAIQGIVNIRDQQNMPIWLGESGENSNAWFTSAISLVEQNKIGWAWWPMKKVGSVVNPFTVVKNPGYDALLNYWKNGGTKPTTEFAKAALMELAENLKIENNIYRKDVVDAMIRQVQSPTETLPFSNNEVPGVVHLSDFDLGRIGKAYHDLDSGTFHVSNGGTYTAWNQGWSYRNDAVDIELANDADENSNDYNIGWTQTGEWMQYTLDVDSSAAYNITLRYATSASTSKIKLLANGSAITSDVSLASTGGMKTWGNKILSDVVLYKGSNKLRFHFVTGGANVGFLKFELSKKINEVDCQAIAAETASSGSTVYVSFNKQVAGATLTSTEAFSATVNGTTVGVTAAVVDDAQAVRVKLTLEGTLADNDVITISYNGDAVQATDGTVLADFTNLPVANKLPFHFAIPTKIEAEAFVVNQGLQLETTSDVGGGQNVGYTSVGDYLEYRIRVPQDGSYPVEARVACNSAAGKIKIEQRTVAGVVLNSVTLDVPVTGGWQTWQTVKSKMTLTAGAGILRVTILQPEFNINWFRFLQADVVNGTETKSHKSLKLYPNPADHYVKLDVSEEVIHTVQSVSIRSLNGATVSGKKLTLNEEQSIYIGDLPAGLYLIELQTRDEFWRGKLVRK